MYTSLGYVNKHMVMQSYIPYTSSPLSNLLNQPFNFSKTSYLTENSSQGTILSTNEVQSAHQIILYHLDWATNCNYQLLIQCQIQGGELALIADSH